MDLFVDVPRYIRCEFHTLLLCELFMNIINTCASWYAKNTSDGIIVEIVLHSYSIQK